MGRGPGGKGPACQRVAGQRVDSEVNTQFSLVESFGNDRLIEIECTGERETEGFYLVTLVLFRSLVPAVASVFALGSSALFHIYFGLQLSDVARPHIL